MKKNFKKITKLINSKISKLILIISILLIPSQGICASTKGRANATILASKENIRTYKTIEKNQNQFQVSYKNNNTVIVNY